MKYKNKITTCFILVVSILFYSCNTNSIKEYQPQVIKEGNKYAQKFTIQDFIDYKKLSIINPLQQANNISFEYYLSTDKLNIPDSLYSPTNFIKIPVRKVVCLSTTHIGFLDALDELNSVVAVANAFLVNNKSINSGLENNSIQDIGSDRNLNYEQLLKLEPDLVFAYGVGIESLEYVNKLQELGIKVILLAEYLENTPLAKTEWIRVLAAFYNKEQNASEILNSIETEYNRACELVLKTTVKPKVITGLPWKGTWYVPGGKSYLAKLINDAGGYYMWNDDNSTESIPLSFESVFQKALYADIWINAGAANNLTNILSVDDRINDFPVFQDKNIFNNNALQNKNGGNDYWERGIMQPEIILKDLIKIFHPEKLPEHNLIFYKKISN